MAIETAPKNEGSTGHTGERVRDTFSKLVYTKAESLGKLAFVRVGINTDMLQPGVRYTTTLTSKDRHSTVTIAKESQLSVNNDDTRLVRLRETIDGEDRFLIGRYVQPDGKMWQIADSSQGLPWYEANLPIETLVAMVERMETIEESDCEVGIEFSAYYRP